MAQQMCRTCLGTIDETMSIFRNIFVSKTEVALTDILLNFYNYKVEKDDGLPEVICDNCVYQLTITYSFKQLIEHSARTLSQYEPSIVDTNDNFDSDFDTKADIPIVKKEVTVKNKIKTRKTYLYCAKCKNRFNSAKSLLHHCKTHPVENNSGRDCQYCNEKFDSFRSLIAHRKQHFALFVCETCWENFDALDDFNTHTCKGEIPEPTDEEQKEPTRTYKQCDQCGKSYPAGYIKYHMMIHGEKRAYSCSYCPKKFKVRCSLNSHVLWMHKRTRKHKCHVCNAMFVSAGAKSTHIRRHHLNEKKHNCESCGKSFFSKSEMGRHMLSHTGVKNFHCHLCSKSYQTRYGLNVHLRSHNPAPDAIHWKEN